MSAKPCQHAAQLRRAVRTSEAVQPLLHRIQRGQALEHRSREAVGQPPVGPAARDVAERALDGRHREACLLRHVAPGSRSVCGAPSRRPAGGSGRGGRGARSPARGDGERGRAGPGRLRRPRRCGRPPAATRPAGPAPSSAAFRVAPRHPVRVVSRPPGRPRGARRPRTSRAPAAVGARRRGAGARRARSTGVDGPAWPGSQAQEACGERPGRLSAVDNPFGWTLPRIPR